jgi:hypothetical protein
MSSSDPVQDVLITGWHAGLVIGEEMIVIGVSIAV